MGRSGTGLGMAVVWGTVKDHRGYITIESEEGDGSTFSLYFPATRKKISTPKGSLSFEAIRGKGESILVVDDMEAQRHIASQLLSALGYKVYTAASGEEAVEFVRKRKVDLMVLDMIMDPCMDGLDTYRKILEIRPLQKAIIASGYSETNRVKETLGLGAGTYIKKPYTMQNIGVAVKEELKVG